MVIKYVSNKPASNFSLIENAYISVLNNRNEAPGLEPGQYCTPTGATETGVHVDVSGYEARHAPLNSAC